MPTLNATITLGVVITVNGDVDVSKFLLNDTEWIGEPKNEDGCVVAINPKTCSITGKGAEHIIIDSVVLPPVVKAIRECGKSRWNKKCGSIESAIRTKEGYELMLQQPGNKLEFKDICEMVGKKVSIIKKDGTIINMMVGL